MKKKWLLFLILSIGLLVAVFSLKLSSSKERFVPVEEKPVKKVVYASGYLKPLHFVIIASEVSGYVRKIYVKEGAYVKKGELLAEIDPESLPARISEIEKRLALVEERLNPDSEYLRALRKEIEMAQNFYLLEKEKWRRREALFREGLISKEALDEAENSFKNARENLERLKNQYQDTLKALTAEKKTLLEQKRALTRELAKYQIRAPFEGIIFKKYVEEGDFVYPIFSESKLFSLGDKNFEVILEVDEEYAGQIRPGNKAFVTFDSLPDKVFQGEVFQIIDEIDRTKRSFTVKVRLYEIPELPAQATCEANIVVEEKRALVIPEKALLKDNTVLVKGRGKVRVSVGERFGEYVEILSGLRKGEVVKIFE